MYALYEYFRRIFTLSFWYVGVQGVLFFYDLLFHSELSYPFWNESYNWAPVLGGALLGVMVASAVWMAVERYAPVLFARTQRQVRFDAAVASVGKLRELPGTALTQMRSTPKRPQLVQ